MTIVTFAPAVYFFVELAGLVRQDHRVCNPEQSTGEFMHARLFIFIPESVVRDSFSAGAWSSTDWCPRHIVLSPEGAADC